jgi:hypothetical protein
MRKYKTGLIAWSNEASNRLIIKGKFFIVRFVKVDRIENISDGYEVIIFSTNYQNARKALQLIASSIALLEGHGYFNSDDLPNLKPLQKDNEEIPKQFWGNTTSSFSGIPNAIKIAAKVSYQKKKILALLKYQLGCELHSNNIMDL